MKVLFNADDFGLTKGVTDGIIKAHSNGVVASTTLMMNGLAVDYAIAQAKKHPLLKVGIHLVLTYGKPISNDVSRLINPSGLFKYRSTTQQIDKADVNQIESEWRAQIEKFLTTGLKLDHIDSHHHVHGWEQLADIVLKLANEYNVPVRYVKTLCDHPEILLTNVLWLDFYNDGVSIDIFDRIKDLNVESVEVMTHPAVIDNDLRQVSSYLDKREMELEILCSLKVPSWVETLD